MVTGPTATHAAGSKAAEAHAVPAHGAGTAEGRVDGGASTDPEYEFSPTDEESVQPHMTAETSSGEHSAETVEPEMPTHEDNQPEVAKPRRNGP